MLTDPGALTAHEPALPLPPELPVRVMAAAGVAPADAPPIR
jgi:hypothetical protein